MPPSTPSVPHSAHPPMTVNAAKKAQSSLTSKERDIDVCTIKDENIPPGTGITDQDDNYPDGGLRAWLVLFGTTFCAFSTFGLINAWGVFQSYYETHLLKGSSPSAIAWIGSTQFALAFLPGPITGRLFDLGYFKIPFFCGSVVLVIAIFLTAYCHKYWHFLLCQGITVGLACAVCFGPTWGVIGHWFKKRRGIATGIMAAGSSIGGIFFPIVTRQLIRIVGFPWTIRILGFILMFTLGISNIVLARRLPPKNVPGGLFNLKAFKTPAFTIYCIASTVVFLGIYTLLTFVDVASIDMGISEDFSFYLVSFANAGGGVGRLVVGLLADKFGPINVISPMTIVAAIIIFIWPYATSKKSLIAVTIIYGFTTSAYLSMLNVPLYRMGAIEDVGRRMGTLMVFMALGGLAGPPLSGAIWSATGSIKGVSYYAGSTIFLAVALILVTRHLVLKKLWGKF